MNKKRFIAALSASVVLLASCGVLTVSAEDTGANDLITASADDAFSGMCGENIKWDFDEETGVLTLSGSGNMDSFEIEDTEEMTIVHTPWEAYKDSIKKVVIGKGITKLSQCAFYRCSSLEEVEGLDSDVYMEDAVFFRTPYFVNNAEQDGALFYLNNQLVDVDEEVSETLREADIRPGTTAISTTYLSFCPDLAKVTLPEGLRYITAGAFYGLEKLETIEVPESVEALDIWTFHTPGLKSITIKNPDCDIAYYNATISNLYDPETYESDYTGVIKGYDGSTAQKYAFYLGYNFESIGKSSAPEANTDASGKCGKDTEWFFDSETGTLTLRGDGNGMMDYYRNTDEGFVKDDHGGTLTNMPWLYLRRYIKTLKIEEGITFIPQAIFQNYFALENVILPEDYIHIGLNFLWTPYYYNNVEKDGDLLYLDNRLVGIDDSVKGTIEELDIRPGTLAVSNNMPADLVNVTAVNIPDSVRLISNSAFQHLEKLETIELPESVEMIDAWSFDTPGLKSITINNPDCLILYDADNPAICNEFDRTTKKCTYNGVIRGYKGSTAQKYAEKYGFAFEALEAEAPSAPTNVKADKDGNVTWDTADNAYAYRVAKVVNGVTYYGSKVKGTSYTFKKNPASDYQLYVIAYGKDGTAKRSSKISIKDEKPLGYVNEVNVDENGKVTWEPADNAVSYIVGKISGGKVYYGRSTEETNYQFKVLPTKDYQVFVVAFDENGRTTWGSKKTVEVGELGTVLDPKADSNGNVTWTAARNAEYYMVGKTAGGKTVYSGKIFDTSYTFKTPARSDYQVSVVAFDGNGNKTFGTKKTVKVNR